MLSIPRTATEWWFAAAAGIAIGSTVLTGASAYELYAFEKVEADKSRRIEGTLELHPKRVVIRNASGLAFECVLSLCRFPGMQAYAGKNLTFWVSGGRVIQIQDGSFTQDAQHLYIEGKKEAIARNALGFLIAIAFAIMGALLTCSALSIQYFLENGRGWDGMM